MIHKRVLLAAGLALLSALASAADIKISALPNGGAIQATDQIPVNRSGTTNRVVVTGTALANILTCSADQIVFDSAGVLVCDAGLTYTTAAGIQIALAEPRYRMSETDQAADLKLWDEDLNAGVLSFRTRTDADGAGKNWLSVTRGATTAISAMSLGNATDNPTLTQLGTGTVTFNSTAISGTSSTTTWGRSRTTSSSPTADWVENDQGADLKVWSVNVQAGVLTWATQTDAFTAGKNFLSVTRGATTAVSNVSFGNSTDNPTGNWLSTGTFGFAGKVSVPGSQSTGTKFTTSGCSVSATTGGATAGTFTLGANTCSVVVTMNGATGMSSSNGWSCQAHDRTAPTVLIGGENASTVSTATIPIPAGAGATDVISFSCVGY